MVEGYSTCGRTRILYASSFTDSSLVGFYISFYKSKDFICLTTNVVNMFIIV